LGDGVDTRALRGDKGDPRGPAPAAWR